MSPSTPIALASLLAALLTAQSAERRRRDPARRGAVRRIALTRYAGRLRRFYGIPSPGPR